jgi:hypothetical protein
VITIAGYGIIVVWFWFVRRWVATPLERFTETVIFGAFIWLWWLLNPVVDTLIQHAMRHLGL